MSDVFISYARSTATEARSIADALRALGYAVWLDDELPPHRSFSEVIEERLAKAKAVVVIWSAEAAKSVWVQSEADHARADHKLVQLSIDGATLPMPFDRIQCADLAGWSGSPHHAAWAKVVASVAALVDGVDEAAAGDGNVPGETHRSTARDFLSRARRRTWVRAGAAAVLVACVGAGLWFTRDRLFGSFALAQHRVAVLPFDVVGGGSAAASFASGLLDDLLGALSTNQVAAESRMDSLALRGPDAAATLRRMGADLLLDGDVESDGKTVRVRMHLDDPRDHVTLWSKQLSGAADQLEALQARVASRAAEVAKWAVSPDLRGAWKDPSLVAAYLEGQDERLNEGGGHDIEIARDVVARAPDLAAGHLLLAASLIDFTRPPNDAPPGAQPQAVAEAVKEANLALKLDPKNAEAWAVLGLATPLSAWREREGLFAKGLAAGMDNPFVAGDYAWFQLYDAGRNYEAIVEQKRDLPQWVPSLLCLSSELVNKGRNDEAWATIVEARRLAPDYWESPVAEFAIAAIEKRYADALALLDDPAAQRMLNPAAIPIYRQALQAAASGNAGEMKAAADRVSAGAASGTLIHRDALSWLAGLGDVDGAFREADLAYTPDTMSPAVGLWYGSTGGTGVLFGPSTLSMRRDPRFIRLAARIGLVDYWRATGHWADFCLEPGLPYDCKAEAARVTGRAS